VHCSKDRHTLLDLGGGEDIARARLVGVEYARAVVRNVTTTPFMEHTVVSEESTVIATVSAALDVATGV